MLSLIMQIGKPSDKDKEVDTIDLQAPPHPRFIRSWQTNYEKQVAWGSGRPIQEAIAWMDRVNKATDVSQLRDEPPQWSRYSLKLATAWSKVNKQKGQEYKGRVDNIEALQRKEHNQYLNGSQMAQLPPNSMLQSWGLRIYLR